MSASIGFRIVFAILFVTVLLVRRAFKRRAQARPRSRLKQDLDNQGLILVQSALLTLGNIGIIVYLINPRWMAWATIEFPGLFGWLGTIVGVASTGLLIWSHIELGDNFFGGVKLHTDHRLITSGPFQWVRHPIYLSLLLLGFAWYLLSGNWLFSLLWIAAAVLAIITRLEQEEAMLFAEFGQEYKNYAMDTPRLIPSFLTNLIDDLLDKVQSD